MPKNLNTRGQTQAVTDSIATAADIISYFKYCLGSVSSPLCV